MNDEILFTLLSFLLGHEMVGKNNKGDKLSRTVLTFHAFRVSSECWG